MHSLLTVHLRVGLQICDNARTHEPHEPTTTTTRSHLLARQIAFEAQCQCPSTQRPSRPRSTTPPCNLQQPHADRMKRNKNTGLVGERERITA